MGYRSSVTIVTRIENKELVKVLKEDNEADNWDNFEQGFIKMYNGDKVQILFAQISYVKWYDSYPSVFRIMDAIHRIEDDESYGFIRIGEEWNDVESLGCPYDYGVNLERYTIFDRAFLYSDEEICECNNLDHQTLNVDCPVNNKEE